MDLELCPCGSGTPYKDCHYLVLDDKGKPMYYHGQNRGDADGNWFPVPSVRLAATLAVKATDKFEDEARALVSTLRLNLQHHDDFTKKYAMFLRAHADLLKILTMEHGEGVSFQMDSLEARESWSHFLMVGRILIDFLGLYCTGPLGLKQKVGGLNREKFESLLKILEHQGRTEPHLLIVKSKLEILKSDVLDFIAMRNREKTHGDTIIEFPAVSDWGITGGGKVADGEREWVMLEFIENSLSKIQELTNLLLVHQ